MKGGRCLTALLLLAVVVSANTSSATVEATIPADEATSATVEATATAESATVEATATAESATVEATATARSATVEATATAEATKTVSDEVTRTEHVFGVCNDIRWEQILNYVVLAVISLLTAVKIVLDKMGSDNAIIATVVMEVVESVQTVLLLSVALHQFKARVANEDFVREHCTYVGGLQGGALDPLDLAGLAYVGFAVAIIWELVLSGIRIYGAKVEKKEKEIDWKIVRKILSTLMCFHGDLAAGIITLVNWGEGNCCPAIQGSVLGSLDRIVLTAILAEFCLLCGVCGTVYEAFDDFKLDHISGPIFGVMVLLLAGFAIVGCIEELTGLAQSALGQLHFTYSVCSIILLVVPKGDHGKVQLMDGIELLER